MGNEIQVVQQTAVAHEPIGFSTAGGFELMQRIAKAMCSSTIVPQEYRGPDKTGNALIAIELANRIGASPMMVMQHLHVIQGRPSFSSQFIISAINTCGKFSPLRYRIDGEGDAKGCTAYATELATGEILEGPKVTIEMAKKEGWYSKSGSKWQTMPELMLRYRSAAFFGRLYAPEITMGMQTSDEADDMIDVTPRSTADDAQSSGVASLNAQVCIEPKENAKTKPRSAKGKIDVTAGEPLVADDGIDPPVAQGDVQDAPEGDDYF